MRLTSSDTIPDWAYSSYIVPGLGSSSSLGLIVVDLVTSRKADLHAELLTRVSGVTATRSELWAAAYRPWQAGEQTNLQAWHHVLALGAALPTLPFWLKNGPCIKVDLDATYMRTLQDLRMLSAGTGAAIGPVS